VEELLDGDGGLPTLLLVENAEADGAGRIDVWVEERRDESACVFATRVSAVEREDHGMRVIGNVHFGGFVGYSSGNIISSLNSPPSQMVLSLPGIAQSQRLRSRVP